MQPFRSVHGFWKSLQATDREEQTKGNSTTAWAQRLFKSVMAAVILFMIEEEFVTAAQIAVAKRLKAAQVVPINLVK